MSGWTHDTTAIQTAHRSRRGLIGLALLLALIGVGVFPLLGHPTHLVEARVTAAPHAPLAVAPVDPAAIAALARQQAQLQERLAVAVAPVDPAAIAALARQPVDPQAIFTALHEAVNAYDIDAAAALFTDDAVVQFPNQPPPNVYRGAQEVRAWLEGDAAQHIQVEAEDLQVAGDQLTWTARVMTDDLRALGVTAVGVVEATLRDGKLASFTFTLSDETLAQLQAATAPQALPSTGAPAALPLGALLILGVSLGGAGLLLRRRG